MTKKDWYEAGDQIKDLVQEAIDSGDYSQLSSTITNVVNGALDSVGDALRDSFGNKGTKSPGAAAARQDGGEEAEKKQASYQSRTTRARQAAADRIRRDMERRPEKTYRPVRKKLKAPGLVVGQVMKWTGYTFGGMFGLSLAILGAVGISTGFSMAVPASILGVLFAGSVVLGVSGSERVSLAMRFRKYTDVLGERTFCLIEELASSVGESSRYVRKDLKKMIRRGFFPQGYLDRKETCLITDQSTYQQYLTAQQAYVVRQMEEERRKQEEQADRKGEEQEQARQEKDRKEQELLDEGRRYIRHIRECNDRIPDEEISDKLDRLETVVTRIFTKAEKDPEVVDDLKKMMSYYLPTTKKLLDAYCELSEQPVQGQNIETTKKEIEAALDTLNTAFEKLLDDLFEEKAWDISSDISVLNTMLEQEGLTGGRFSHKAK